MLLSYKHYLRYAYMQLHKIYRKKTKTKEAGIKRFMTTPILGF